MRLLALAGIVGLALGVMGQGATTGPTFEFEPPWNDASPTAIDLSGLIPRPAGARGFVRATADGHLAVDDGRIKFWGTNTTFGGSFPDKADADAIAARLAKFGVNIVRFHHMDTSSVLDGGAGIWTTSYPDRVIDAGQLDKLDYFIAKLKDHGIYADLNLLVGRPFNRSGDDLPAAIDAVADWKSRAAVGFFEPSLQALQRQYATDLLTHVNPYTGLRYTEDPAVAIIEINNENGLIQAYLVDQLDALPGPLGNDLARDWNTWLKARYGSERELERVWGVSRGGLGGEMLTNGSFSSGSVAPWNGEEHDTARAAFSVDGGAARIDITAVGTAFWHVQFNEGGLAVQTNHPYTVSFHARASVPRTITVDCGMGEPPWEGLGFNADVPLSTEWKTFSFTFSTTRDFANARINFGNMGLETGTVWITDVSLKPGGAFGLADNERLDNGTIRAFRHHGDTVARTFESSKDWIRFLLEKEHAYWTMMRSHVRDTLGAKAVIVGTIVGASTPNLMADFDALDSHAYWRHPEFPGIPWDPVDWFVRNDPMVNDQDAATMTGLAMTGAVGKPHLVTEYNHPGPNTFQAEAMPFLATYGAFQDFDAVFSFDYASVTHHGGPTRTTGFFDIEENPVKMATFLPSAAAFLRGDILPGQSRVVVPVSRADEVDELVRSNAWELVTAQTAGVNPLESLRHRVAVLLEGGTQPSDAIAPGLTDVSSRVAVSDTGQITWDASGAPRGYVTVDTPRTKLAWGFIGSRTIELSGVRIEVGKAMPSLHDGFAFVGLTALDGAPIATARRLVLTAVGTGQNTGEVFYNYPDTLLTFPAPMGTLLTTRGTWGMGPFLAEGVSVAVGLPAAASQIRVWALDPTGARRTPVRVFQEGDRATLYASYQSQTLWYEFEIAR